MADSPTSYLVCATHRSGSNLLCQVLWHTGLAGYPQEAFSPTRSSVIAKEHQLGADPDSDFPAYVRALMAARRTPNGVFGAKIMWKHLGWLCSRLGWVDGNAWQVLANVFDHPRCVWMRRRDAVRQAISMVKAKQTRVYNSLQGTPDAPSQAPSYDFAALDKEVKRFRAEDTEWETFFRTHGITPFPVFYEDFILNRNRDTRDLLRFLGQSVPEDYQSPPSDYVRLADAVNDSWEERYHADAAKHT